jgi:acyl dehydratase
MPIDYDRLKNWPIPDQVNAYDERDCMLYALGLGYGADPLDASDLPFVFERDLRVVPSLFTVIGAPGAWATDPGTGIDWMKILHGEHRMALHAPPPPQGVLRSRTRVARIVDKGPGRGALVITERAISDEATGRLLATIEHTSFCRADGGIGRTDAPPVALPTAPLRAPNLRVSLPTLPGAALLYRLNGDRNPIHADPSVARAAGFERPILHGLCTYGMACRAILQACCDNEPSRLSSLSLRFSAPFLPGDTLRVDIWRDGDTVLFEGVSQATQTRVLSHGHASLRP